MTAFLARLSSPARYILLLSTCLLIIFGPAPANVYAAPTSGARCVTSWNGLRVRSGPGTSTWIKAVLPSGTRVNVTQTTSYWSKVTYSGSGTGWMYSAYLGRCTTVRPTAVPTQPPCNIKGNVSYYGGEKIYHVPGQLNYNGTIISSWRGERWFCTEAEARDAGWRKAKR